MFGYWNFGFGYYLEFYCGLQETNFFYLNKLGLTLTLPCTIHLPA